MTNFNFFSRLASWMDGLSSRIRPVSLSYSGSSMIACSTERQPRDNREMSEQQSGARVAREWLKYAAIFVMLFSIGIGNAWGASMTFTFSSKAWAASPANWSGTKDGYQFNSSGTPLGVQICTGQSGVVVTSPTSFDAITQVDVVYSSSSKGVGSIGVQIGTNTALTAKSISKSQTRTTLTFTPASAQTGVVKITCNCTTNSYGINSVTIYYRTAVTLNANGGASNQNATINHDARSTTSFTACTRDGYACTGYYTASSGGTKILNAEGTFAASNISESTIHYVSSSKWAYTGATLTLYAQWEVAGKTVYLIDGCSGDAQGSYSCNTGTTGSGTGDYSGFKSYSGIAAGTSVTITATPEDDYQFLGWTDGGDYIILNDELEEITPSSTTSTTATFTMPSTDVVIMQCNFAVACDKSITIETGSPTNCTISASATNVSTCSGSRRVTISVTPSSCYAAPLAASITTSGTEADLISGPTLNAGKYDYVYEFAENATGTTTFNASLSTKTTYTVQYNAGTTTATGGNAISGSHANDTKTCGINMTLPGATFTTIGYTQDGWSTSNGGTKTYNLGATDYAIDANSTIYPHWAVISYSVTWMVNGSEWSGKGGSSSVEYGSHISTLPTTPDPKNDACGDKFVGWTDATDGNYVHETSNLYKTADDFPNASGAQVFYAVFADYDE